MARRVTTRDIAEALGVSRNTVSKAINNTGNLADATRKKVLKKAKEMGYKQFSYMDIADVGRQGERIPATGTGEIVLFTTGFIGNMHFVSTMIDKFQSEIDQLGYSFTIYRVQREEIENLQLPRAYSSKKTAGIICIEMFDRNYCSMLYSLNKPILFVDSPVFGCDEPLRADYLYMDNRSGIRHFVAEMVRRGKRQIGFIGEYLHCQSFYERYMAYRDALYFLGLSCKAEYSVIGNKDGGRNSDAAVYREYLTECLQKMDRMPEVFICANDFVALEVLQVLKGMGISVPEDVWLCGFDDSPESRIVDPSLTTIHIHSQIMGLTAVQLLATRIQDQSLNFRVVHTETNLLYRKSTGD